MEVKATSFSKEEVETCVDEADCQAKLQLKTCSTQGASAIYTLDPNEIYCTLETPEHVGENASLKSSYDSSKATADAQKLALDSQVYDMDFGKKLYAGVMLMNKSNGLSKAQRKQLRNDLKDIRSDLFDGDICSAREDIDALVADEVLIKSADKSAILAKIDAYKTCP